MGFVLAFLAALVATVVGATLFLIRRERARRRWAGETEECLLIEQHRTAQAARLRSTYTSAAIHNGTGLLPQDLHEHQP
ncbi:MULTISPECIES: hypothetical protein [Kitasatospora]|uniref:Secreted protein n=1 Tax=Kitasatospora cathayae TaxID=3004092 RepID=A0ABY7Q8T2_9ACTN|nr:hypothetical protein [Kitasatospora sp. HUAS 3-15]WBP88961.1 hypothetical protein O1G21_26075 [Kitasatospora sp. HUAS 3-15]